ncbi:unnamed protein product [Aphanomyces euteiches]
MSYLKRSTPRKTMVPPLRLQCQYAYKACTNIRTMKKDGDIHKLCAFHRDRANNVQKRYASKRRQRIRELKRASHQLAPSSPAPSPPTNEDLPALKMALLDFTLPDDLFEPLWTISDCNTLSVEESEMLSQLFELPWTT